MIPVNLISYYSHHYVQSNCLEKLGRLQNYTQNGTLNPACSFTYLMSRD